VESKERPDSPRAEGRGDGVGRSRPGVDPAGVLARRVRTQHFGQNGPGGSRKGERPASGVGVVVPVGFQPLWLPRWFADARTAGGAGSREGPTRV